MIESLFFMTYNSYLNGDLESTKMYFQFLVEEYTSKNLSTALSKHQRKELLKIKNSIDSGIISTNSWINESKAPIIEKEKSDIKQKELVKKIHYEAFNQLKEYLKSDNSLELYGIEFPCNPYGIVDMVYKNKETIYPIEVKINEGKHDLIGQINKYTLYFKKLLNLKQYFNVKPVTICHSYNQHTLTELKRSDVLTLKYNNTEEMIKLKII